MTVREKLAQASRLRRQTRLPMVDRLPEHVHYADSGCQVAPSCLNCPLERCRYEEPEGGKGATLRARDQEVYRAYLQHGPDIRWLASHFGVSRRTIHRIVRRFREDRERSGA